MMAAGIHAGALGAGDTKGTGVAGFENAFDGSAGAPVSGPGRSAGLPSGWTNLLASFGLTPQEAPQATEARQAAASRMTPVNSTKPQAKEPDRPERAQTSAQPLLPGPRSKKNLAVIAATKDETRRITPTSGGSIARAANDHTRGHSSGTSPAAEAAPVATGMPANAPLPVPAPPEPAPVHRAGVPPRASSAQSAAGGGREE